MLAENEPLKFPSVYHPAPADILPLSREAISEMLDIPLKPATAKTVLVAGSRSVHDLGRVMAELAIHLNEAEGTYHIISGGCSSGPDVFAKQYAELNRIPYKEYPADWKNYGRAGGPIRNKEMVAACDMAILFWDGVSSGTEGTRMLLEDAGKPYCCYHWPEYAGKKLKRVPSVHD